MGAIAARWEPESPFLDRYAPEHEGAARAPATAPGITFLTESPFVSEYELGDQLAAVDPTSEAVAELLAELHDEEFDVAVHELVDEASTLAGARTASELGDSRALEARVERMLEEHFAPLARRSEDLMDRMAEHLGSMDPLSMTEAELDEVLDRYTPGRDGASPTFEFFLKKLWNKAKKVAKGAVKLAAKAAGGFLLGPLLKKLGALVKPLLKKVLAMALDKIPPQYRPLATQLAQKFGLLPKDQSSKPKSGLPAPATAPAAAPAEPSTGAAADADASSADAAATPAELTTADVGQVQSELDETIAELLLAREEGEQEVLFSSYAAEASQAPSDPLAGLDRARTQFIQKLGDLQEGESPAPVVEHFIPAILTALKLGIRVIGRPRVVSLLGGLIGKLVGPLVGNKMSPALGRALADVGLRVVLQSEVTVDQAREAAGQAIAATVEETVRRVASLPEHVLDNEALLEGHSLQAFESAAAANFPPSLVRPELREANADATWIALPARGSRKYYRKYTKVFDVDITPQITSSIRTFGGSTLAAFFRDRLRLAPHVPVKAKVHLYQTLQGARLSHITRNEQARGLSQIALLHPLTPEAASALLREPRLGRAALGAHPLRPKVGQRFYYLEIEGAPARTLGKQSHLHLTVNFPGDEIRACMFIGEVVAQEIATQLRKGTRPGVAVARLRSLVASEADALAADRSGRLLKVILEPRGPAAPPGTLAAAASDAGKDGLRRQVGQIAVGWLWDRLAAFLERNASQFIQATEGPEDGVTIAVTFHNPPGLQAVRKVFRGAPASTLEGWPPKQVPQATVKILPGLQH